MNDQEQQKTPLNLVYQYLIHLFNKIQHKNKIHKLLSTSIFNKYSKK